MAKQKNTDEAAFIALMEANQGIVHKICRVYARTEEDRKDLFQDITMQLWRAWPCFEQRCKVSTWMYRIALNVAISGLRKKGIVLEDLTDRQYQLPDNAPDTGLTEQISRLYAALDRLTPIEKSLALLMLEDYSYDEMVQITGVSAANLRVKTHRIREKLKTLI